MAATVQVEKFMPRDNVKIETDPNAKADDASGGGGGGHQDVDSRIASLCAQLDSMRQQLPAGFRVSPVLFEKDDDANFHMDLITALANMRARNYGITEVCAGTCLRCEPAPHSQWRGWHHGACMLYTALQALGCIRPRHGANSSCACLALPPYTWQQC